MNNLAAQINRATGVTRMQSGSRRNASKRLARVMRNVSRGGKGG